MNEKLTHERLQAARDEFQLCTGVLRLFEGGDENGDLVKALDDFNGDAIDTCMAALDFIEQFRWRKPEEADINSKAMVIAILADNTRENTFECVVAKYPEQHLAWMPLPEWEGEGMTDLIISKLETTTQKGRTE